MSSIKVKRSKLHLIWEIPVGIIVTIIEIAVVAVVGLNATKSLIYSDYYGIKEDLGVIPGLNGSATPQGISVDENTDTYFFSSYRTNGEPSAIFTQKDGESTEFLLYQDEACTVPFTGHVGGIATDGEKVYLANSEGEASDYGRLYIMDIDEFYNDSDTAVCVGAGITVLSAASFVYTDDEYLYIGEFENGNQYITNNAIEVNDELTQLAVCAKYSLEDLNTVVAIYSIPSSVQGFAIDKDGGILLSTSYGLANSNMYYYAASEIKEATSIPDWAAAYDCPVYILEDGKATKTLTMPPMSEDLDYDTRTGKFITLNESASNKYIFGKFFLANKYVSLDIEAL